MAQTEIIEATLQELLPRLRSLPAAQRYQLIPLSMLEAAAKPFYETATPEEWSRAWREWAASHSSDTPALSEDAVSRDSIYEGRG